MFDVGFSEIIVIVVVALIVIGPDKLPKLARTYGLLYGRAQRYVSGVKQDLDRQIALDTMRKATADAQQKLLAMQAQLVEVPSVMEAQVLTPEAVHAAPQRDTVAMPDIVVPVDSIPSAHTEPSGVS